MNRAPAFQFYPDKWLAGTAHLSAEAYRAYHRLLCWIWCHTKSQFSIQNKDELLQIATGLKPDAFHAVWAEIQNPDAPLLKSRRKMLISNGLRKEAKKQEHNRQARTDAANARWKKCKRNANASVLQCSPITTPSIKERTCSEQSSLASEPPFIPEELTKLALYRADAKLIAQWDVVLPAWKEANPGIDVVAEIRKAHAWELANPKKRKRDRIRFLDSWLRRAQDSRGGRNDSGPLPTVGGDGRLNEYHPGPELTPEEKAAAAKAAAKAMAEVKAALDGKPAGDKVPF